jgi:hypothetical protein
MAFDRPARTRCVTSTGDMTSPAWLSLLAPLPQSVKPVRKPVASAAQIETGTAGPIAGWENVTVYLSEPDFGLRHVHVTLDATGKLLAAGDHVMFVRETSPDGVDATLSDHESIGGRFEDDGSFRGTCWKTRLRSKPDGDEGETVFADHSPPTAEQIAALKLIVEDVLRRSARE